MHASAIPTSTIMHGDYLLLTPIGGEPDCQVFRARSRRDGRVVAARLIQQSQLAVFGSAAVLGKAEIASRLSHPALAALEAYGQESTDTWCMVSEFVEGPRMDEWADALGIPPLIDLIDMIHRVCQGLHTAHRAGIAHDRLHPGNLIVLPRMATATAPLEIKVLDLCVPALVRPWPPELHAAAFMAPEHLTLDDPMPSSADVRGNVYSCGALLYYLCTGGPPFQSRNVDELVAHHREGRLVAPSKINPRVPAALEEAILRALSLDPRMRYPSTAELANALALIRLPLRLSSSSRAPGQAAGLPREPWMDHADFADFPPESQFPPRGPSHSLAVPKHSAADALPGAHAVTQRHTPGSSSSIRPPLGSFSSPPGRDSGVGLASERPSASSSFFPERGEPASASDDSSRSNDEPLSSPTLVLQPGELQEVSGKYEPIETLEALEPLEAPEQSLDIPEPPYRTYLLFHSANLVLIAATLFAGATLGPVAWLVGAFIEAALLWVVPDLPAFRQHVELRTSAVRIERERTYYLKQLFGLVEVKRSPGQRLLGLFIEQPERDLDERIVDQKHESARNYRQMRQLAGEVIKIARMRGVSVPSHEQLLERIVNRFLGLLLIRRLLASALAEIDGEALTQQIERVQQQLTHATPEARVVLHESLDRYHASIAKLSQLQLTLQLVAKRIDATRKVFCQLHGRALGEADLDLNAVLSEMAERKTIAADPFAELRTDRLMRELLVRPA